MDALIAVEHGHGDGSYEPVSLGAGAWVPDRFRVRLDDPARPLRAVVDFTVVDGAVRVASVRQEPRDGVTLVPDDFRLPVGRLVETALAALTLRGPVRPAGGRLTDHEVLADATGIMVGDVLRERRRRVLTPELLAEVAEVYAAARATRVRVRVAVAQRWLIPENTARNWIAAARRAGLLDPR